MSRYLDSAVVLKLETKINYKEELSMWKKSRKKRTFAQAVQFGNWSLDVLTAVEIGILAGLLMEHSTPHGVATLLTPLLALMYIFGIVRITSPKSHAWQNFALWGSLALMCGVLIAIAAIGCGVFDGSDIAKWYITKPSCPH
jgi:hypothetical protein